MPAKRHAARVIHPWRTSGVNSPGYSQRPQQAPAAPQRQQDDWDDGPMTVDLGTPKAHSLAHFLAAQATAARWASLPVIPNGQPSMRVRVGGVPVVLPGTWEIFIGRSTDGIETAYGLDDDGVVHLVMLRRDGTPAEMVDVPDHVLDHIRDWAFPGNTS